MRERSEPKQKTGSGVIIRTKNKVKISKALKKGMEHNQAVFNDPLYQYLDNQVYNKQQHNFGPWVEMDKKSRDKKSRNKVQRSLPVLIQNTQTNSQTLALSPPSQEYLEYRQIQSPIFERSDSKMKTLRQLRSVSLELQPCRTIQPPKFRKESIPNKQPFYTRSQDLFNLKSIKSYSSQKRSHFLFNRIFKEQSYKSQPQKAPTFKSEKAYCKVKIGFNPEMQSEMRNRQLLRELKQYRLNKLK